MSDHISATSPSTIVRAILASTLATAAVAIGAAPACAELVASGTNTAPTFFAAGGPFPVDVNGPAAGTTLAFACAVATPVMITYSAECSHNGTVAQWGSIQILLNGVALPPTAGGDDAFCSGNATAAHDGYATQSMEVVGRCRLGANVVAVTASGLFAGTTLRLDDMSTVVDR